MRKSTTLILLSILPVITPLPGPVKMGLEDVAMEMVLCEQLDGACNSLTEEKLEPVVMKLEKAVESRELDFGNDLYDELETRVGRLLCGLDYNQFCTAGGRSVLQEESALCRLEGINCKSRGRTLDVLLDAKKQFFKDVLGIEDGSGDGDMEASGSGDGDDVTTTNDPMTTTTPTEEEDADVEEPDEKGIFNTLTDKVLNAKMEILKAGFNVKAGAISLAAKAIGGLASLGSEGSGDIDMEGSGDMVDMGEDDKGAVTDEEFMIPDQDGSDEDTAEGSADGSGEGSGSSLLESVINTKIAVAGAAAKAVDAVATVVVGGVAAKIDAASEILGATAELGANVAKPTADLVGVVLGSTKHIAETKLEAVQSSIENLSDIASDTLNAKAVLTKASVKTAALGAEGALNLTQSVVNGALNIKLAALDLSSNIVKAVLKTKATVMNTIFDKLKFQINGVLCKLEVKCPKE